MESRNGRGRKRPGGNWKTSRLSVCCGRCGVCFGKGRTSDYTGKQRICRTDRRGRLLSGAGKKRNASEKIQIATDARLWKSGEKTTLCQKIKLPAELAEPEEQKLYLALYRRRDGRTISFANQGEKQGRPFLGIFKIDPIVLI